MATARCSCGSKIPTESAPHPRTSSRSSTRCAGWSWTGTATRSSSPSARIAIARRSSSCSPPVSAYHSNATADDVRAFKERHGDERGFRGEAEESGAGAPAGGGGRPAAGRRPHPRGDDVRARAHGRPGDRPAPTDPCSTTSPSRSTTSTPASRHVVRGEDHLSNTPKQLVVLEALGRATSRLRAPAAPPRPGRQEALQAPRRGLGTGSCATPATSPSRAQLPRPPRLGP
jgi:hypothetical protein